MDTVEESDDGDDNGGHGVDDDSNQDDNDYYYFFRLTWFIQQKQIWVQLISTVRRVALFDHNVSPLLHM